MVQYFNSNVKCHFFIIIIIIILFYYIYIYHFTERNDTSMLIRQFYYIVEWNPRIVTTQRIVLCPGLSRCPKSLFSTIKR